MLTKNVLIKGNLGENLSCYKHAQSQASCSVKCRVSRKPTCDKTTSCGKNHNCCTVMSWRQPRFVGETIEDDDATAGRKHVEGLPGCRWKTHGRPMEDDSMEHTWKTTRSKELEDHQQHGLGPNHRLMAQEHGIVTYG